MRVDDSFAVAYGEASSGDSSYYGTPSAGPLIAANLACASTGRSSLRILDVGAGDGRYTKAFLKRGHRVCAVDDSLAARDRLAALKRFDTSDNKLLVASEIPHAVFDLVVANTVLDHMHAAERSQVVRDLAAVLAPRAVLYFKTFATYEQDRPTLWETSATANALRDLPRADEVDWFEHLPVYRLSRREVVFLDDSHGPEHLHRYVEATYLKVDWEAPQKALEASLSPVLREMARTR